jgi:hypothetical protein
MTIASILTKYARPSSLHSAEPVKQRFLEDLRKQKQFNNRLYCILFVVVLSVTLVGIGALAFDLIKGETLRLQILAGAGLGVPFMLIWMRRVVREWSQMTLLITLVGHSDENAIQALIQKLLSSIQNGPSETRT